MRVALALFRDRGFDGTTVDDIATRAEVSKSSIYTHFDSKEDLLSRGVAPFVDSLTSVFDRPEATSGTYVHRLEFVLRTLVRRGLSDPTAASVVLRLDPATATGRAVIRRRKDAEQRVIELVTAGALTGELRADIDPALAARLLLSMSNWVSIWYRTAGAWRVDELIGAVVTVALEGLSRPER
jgi:AcrR family transcriptional regulator